MAVRLRRVEEQYGDSVVTEWIGYPLVPGEVPSRPITQHSIDSRAEADQEEPHALFGEWDVSQNYPNTSMRALEAAKCAALQGDDAFDRYHRQLFLSFFAEGNNISDPMVLVQIAQAAGLNVEAFASEFAGCFQREAVLDDFRQAVVDNDINALGLPVVIANDEFRIVGAAPAESYSQLIDHYLSKQVSSDPANSR